MFRRTLIGSLLAGVITTPALYAEQAPAPQFQPVQPAQTPEWVQQRTAPALPAWVEERRTELGIGTESPRSAPQPPAWVSEQRAQMSPPTPPSPPERPRPEAPVFVPVPTEAAARPDAQGTSAGSPVAETPPAPEPPSILETPDWVQDSRTRAATTARPAWVEKQRAEMSSPTPPVPPERPPLEATPMAERPSGLATPEWVRERRAGAGMPARPAWVDEQRAQMSAPQPPQRPDREAAPTLRPLPDWVKENRAQIAPPQAPEPPTPPVRAMQGDAVTQAPMRDTGAQADRPAPPQKPTPPAPMADLHRPWRGAPHGGWHRPYGGWNNGWAPWSGGWGGNNWWPWSGGWGGNNWWPWSGGWGRGYNYGAYRPYHPPAAPMRMPMPAPRQQVPADADADGVADGTDLCPDTAAGVAVDALGCDNAARIVLRGVNFKTDSDELTPESLAILDGVSATLAANPGIKVMVAGHTDSDGEDAYNKDLSQRRAQRVVDYLAEQGVDSRNMIAKGFGEEQPVVGNDTPEGKAQNRRVELNRL